MNHKELDLCREELVNEQNRTEKLNQNLLNAKRNIKTLKEKNERLQMTSENGKNENLRKRIRQLEREKTELVSKVRDLTFENQNLQNSLDTCNDQNGDGKK